MNGRDIALRKALKAWESEPITGEKYVYFDRLVKDEYGIELIYHGITCVASKVIDEKKYLVFLLKWL